MIPCKYDALFQDSQPIEIPKTIGKFFKGADPKHTFCAILSTPYR
jgi:hypothetical protein